MSRLALVVPPLLAAEAPAREPLTSDAVDPVSRQPAFEIGAVNIEKAGWA